MPLSNETINSMKREGNETYWVYKYKIGSIEKIAASCSLLRSDEGLCVSIIPYKNTIVTIYYSDNNQDNIYNSRKTVTSSLARWDNAPH